MNAALRRTLLTLALATPVAAPCVTPMGEPAAGDRILVISPHPDDETLCCAGLLQRAQRRGASVGVVWITAGDGFELDTMLEERTLFPHGRHSQRLGTQRLAEAHAAADRLGVPAANQFVLGYPDRGVEPLLGEYLQRPYQSTYTGLSAVSYPQALSPQASYTGEHLRADLARVLDQFRPTLVLAAAPEDTHPDHRGSGELARALLQQRGQLSELRYWIVHAPHWPRPLRYRPDLALTPPASAQRRTWLSFELTPAERAGKLAALQEHHSQMDVIAPLLRSFVRSNELFACPDVYAASAMRSGLPTANPCR